MLNLIVAPFGAAIVAAVDVGIVDDYPIRLLRRIGPLAIFVVKIQACLNYHFTRSIDYCLLAELCRVLVFVGVESVETVAEIKKQRLPLFVLCFCKALIKLVS